jgi:hypothetical protein
MKRQTRDLGHSNMPLPVDSGDASGGPFDVLGSEPYVPFIGDVLLPRKGRTPVRARTFTPRPKRRTTILGL